MNDAAQLSIYRQFIRWLVLAAFTILALHYLMSAVYSIWVAVGSPDPHPAGWSRRAIGQLCFALAALFFGIGLFKGVRTFPGATRRSAAFIVLGALLAISPYIWHFVLIDKCLDRGGSWNSESIQCSDE